MKPLIINILVSILVIIGIFSYELSIYLRDKSEDYSIFFLIIAGLLLIVPAVYNWKKFLEKYIK